MMELKLVGKLLGYGRRIRSFLKSDKKTGKAKTNWAAALRRKIRKSKRKDNYDLNCIDNITKYTTAHLFVDKRTKRNA